MSAGTGTQKKSVFNSDQHQQSCFPPLSTDLMLRKLNEDGRVYRSMSKLDSGRVESIR
jgi:hypothetical protein